MPDRLLAAELVAGGPGWAGSTVPFCLAFTYNFIDTGGNTFLSTGHGPEIGSRSVDGAGLPRVHGAADLIDRRLSLIAARTGPDLDVLGTYDPTSRTSVPTRGSQVDS